MLLSKYKKKNLFLIKLYIYVFSRTFHTDEWSIESYDRQIPFQRTNNANIHIGNGASWTRFRFFLSVGYFVVGRHRKRPVEIRRDEWVIETEGRSINFHNFWIRDYDTLKKRRERMGDNSKVGQGLLME